MRGIAIPFEDVEVMDLDFLYLHSKGGFVDGDRRAVIVIEPDEELMKALKRLKVRYRELTNEETLPYVRELLLGD